MREAVDEALKLEAALGRLRTAQLVALLTERVRNGLPLRDHDDQPVTEPAHVRALLERGVDAGLQRLAHSAMLVG